MHGMNEKQKVQLYADLAEKIGDLAIPVVMNANLEQEDFPQVLAAACAISIVQMFRQNKGGGEVVAALCMNSIYQTCKRNGIPVGKKGDVASSLVGINGSPLTIVEGSA
jgi:hypothetical protein